MDPLIKLELDAIKEMLHRLHEECCPAEGQNPKDADWEYIIEPLAKLNPTRERGRP